MPDSMQTRLRVAAIACDLLFPSVAQTCRDVADELDAEQAEVTAAREGKAHRPGTATERAAAAKKLPTWGTQKALLLDFLYERGGEGLIHDEVEVEGPARGIKTNAHRTRMGNLEDDGLVVKTSRTRESRTGTLSDVWVLSMTGIRYVERMRGQGAR